MTCRKNLIVTTTAKILLLFSINFSQAQTYAGMHPFFYPFVPLSTDPTMTVNIRFFVFSPNPQNSGVWGQVTPSAIQAAVDSANSLFANNPPAKIKSPYVVDISDSKIY